MSGETRAGESPGGAIGSSVPGIATDAVMVQSEEMPEGSQVVKVSFIDLILCDWFSQRLLSSREGSRM